MLVISFHMGIFTRCFHHHHQLRWRAISGWLSALFKWSPIQNRSLSLLASSSPHCIWIHLYVFLTGNLDISVTLHCKAKEIVFEIQPRFSVSFLFLNLIEQSQWHVVNDDCFLPQRNITSDRIHDTTVAPQFQEVYLLHLLCCYDIKDNLMTIAFCIQSEEFLQLVFLSFVSYRIF